MVGAVLQVAEGRPRARCSADGGSLRSSPLAAARRCQFGTLNYNESFGETQNRRHRTTARFSPAKFTGGTTRIYNINVPNSATGAGINGNAVNGGNNINMFSNPAAIFNEFRPCILGYDTSCGSSGQIRGMSNWNMDLNVAKDFSLFRERVLATLSFQFVNVFNHVVLAIRPVDRQPQRLGRARFERERRSELASAADFQLAHEVLTGKQQGAPWDNLPRRQFHSTASDRSSFDTRCVKIHALLICLASG